MITINDYNPSSVGSNYQVGDVYTFYIHNPNMKRLVPVKENEFEVYINSLIDMIEKNKNVIENNTQYLNFTKSIGIVIDTHDSTKPNEPDYITVLFKTPSNDFVINKYVTNYTPTSL